MFPFKGLNAVDLTTKVENNEGLTDAEGGGTIRVLPLKVESVKNEPVNDIALRKATA